MPIKTPMQFHLIQRGTIKPIKRGEIVGIDCQVDYDYMGSAEFEFGALPTGMKAIVGLLPALQIIHTKIVRQKDNAGLFVITRKEDFADILQFIKEEHSEGNSHHVLQERTDLKEAIDGGGRYPSKTDFWWDIENNWMACFGKSNAERLLLGLQKVKSRKGW